MKVITDEGDHDEGDHVSSRDEGDHVSSMPSGLLASCSTHVSPAAARKAGPMCMHPGSWRVAQGCAQGWVPRLQAAAHTCLCQHARPSHCAASQGGSLRHALVLLEAAQRCTAASVVGWLLLALPSLVLHLHQNVGHLSWHTLSTAAGTPACFCCAATEGRMSLRHQDSFD